MDKLQQSVARRVPLKLYQSADHITAAIGKTVAVVISKNMAAFGNPSAGATNATEVGSGWYYVDLSTTDTATLGPLVVRGTASDSDDTEAVFQVGVVDANIVQSLGSAIFNSDFTVASATSTTVTLPSTYTDTTTLPDDSRYVGAVLGVVSGTGQGQMVILTTATGSARQYNVFAGTMPVQLDSTSKCLIFQTSRARADLAGVSVTTNNDKTGYTLDVAVVVSMGVAVVDQALAGHTATGTVGGALSSILDDTGTSGVVVASGGIIRASFGADTGLQPIRSGTAAGGAATTITLDGSASATNNIYSNCLVYITGGAGAGQAPRRIRSYVGSTKVATVSRAWTVNPDNTSTFAILPAESVWEEIQADHVAAGTTGASLGTASTAGDPLNTAIPGSYAPGTAGYVLGNTVNTMATRILGMLEVDGPVYRYTVNALEQAPIGGGGGGGATANQVWEVPDLENGETPKDMMRLFRAILVGETPGVVSGSQAFTSADGLTTRVTADVGSNGSRANVTTDPD